MARSKKTLTTRKTRAKKSAPTTMATRNSGARKNPVAKRAAKLPRNASGDRKPASSSVTTQVKDTAMKMLAGAASGAVQALIPPLEEAASRGAKSAGTDKIAAAKPSQPRQ